MFFTVVDDPETRKPTILVCIGDLYEFDSCWVDVLGLYELKDSPGPDPWSILFDEEKRKILPLLVNSPWCVSFLPSFYVPTGGLNFSNLFDCNRKIVAVGLNYRDHADEFGDEYPTEPLIFCKASSALNRNLGDIVLPSSSSRVDYEGELVAVIGKTCRNVAPENALDYVFGYCYGNDVSARDWQKDKPGGQWFLGKSFDTFAPVGPWVVTPDEIGDPNNLNIKTRVNGEVVQSSNTSRMIFKVPEIISYVSNVMTLNPGDLVYRHAQRRRGRSTPASVSQIRRRRRRQY